ncbi:MAG: pirin family protein [Rhodospirillales bacterium]|nr:MAG: pirin family protein [Rhodospirillales bacterium]
MSWQPCDQAEAETHDPADTVSTVIIPHTRDLGGFQVRRVLPSTACRMVGPFVFFDEMGPADFAPGTGIDVRPHPHIGLATITYLFTGEILHRDSLGTVQPIRPGEVNWMTAGRGIVHSERTGPEVRASGGPLAGIQAWVALPKHAEEIEPAFSHHGSDVLPLVEDDGVRIRIIAGTLAGVASPVPTLWPMVYADAVLEAGSRFRLPPEHVERAVYVVSGAVETAGQMVEKGRMAVFRGGRGIDLRADGPTRLMIAGGEPMDGPRHVWWNFVSSSKDRLEQAKADWQARRFPTVPGDDERIPLPE